MKKKRFLSVILSLAMVLSMLPVIASAAGYTDTSADWSAAALQAAVDNGLIKGPIDKLLPNNYLTRAETAAIINRAFGAQETSSLAGFTDVSHDKWYYNDMAIAVHMQTFCGSDGKLTPDAPITREQAFTVLARALKLNDGSISALSKFADANQISVWAQDSVAALVTAGFLNGSNGKLNPQGKITRAEFAQVMYNTFKYYIKTAGTYTAVSANGNAIINVPDVTLKDTAINGDLIIGDGVGIGNVTLDNVAVTGRLVVRGGGVNSIHIKGGSKIQQLIITKTDGNIRIVVEGQAVVEIVVVEDGKDNIVIAGAVGTVTVKSDDAKIVLQDAKIATMVIQASGASVSGTGTVTKAAVEANGVHFNIPGTNLTVKSGITGTTSEGTSVPAGSTITTVSSGSSNGSSIGGSSGNNTGSSDNSGSSGSNTGSGGGDNGPTPTTANVTTYSDLQAALANSNYSIINLNSDVVIPGSETLTVPYGKILVLNGKITVPDGAVLSNSGTIESPSTALFASRINLACNLTSKEMYSLIIPQSLFAAASSSTKIEVQGSGKVDVNPNANIHFNSLSEIITPAQDSMLLYAGAKVKVGDKQYLGDNSGNAIIQLSNYDSSTAPVAGWFINGDGDLVLVIFEKATVLKPDSDVIDIHLIVKAGINGAAPGELDIPDFSILKSNGGILNDGGTINVESNGKLVVNGTSVMSENDTSSAFNATGGETDNRRGVLFFKNGSYLNVAVHGDVVMNNALAIDSGLTLIIKPEYFEYNSQYGEDLHTSLDIKFTPDNGYFSGYSWDATSPAATKFYENSSQQWLNETEQATSAAAAIFTINNASGGDASAISWGDLYDTGATNVINANLGGYQEAISSSAAGSLDTVTAIQTLINNVNLAPYIAIINNAAGNASLASSITAGDLIAVGAANVITNNDYLSSYQAVIAAASPNSLNTITAIQTIVNIARITYASGDGIRSSSLAAADLSATGAANIVSDNLAAYRVVIGNTSPKIDTLAEVQNAIDTANTDVAKIALAAGSTSLSQNISLDDLHNAGIVGFTIGNITYYQDAIAAASTGSLSTTLAIQSLVDSVNAVHS